MATGGGGRRRSGSKVDDQRTQLRRRGARRRPRRRQRQRDVVPALAGLLTDGGAAADVDLGRNSLAAGREAHVVKRRPGRMSHLVAQRDVGLERGLRDHEHLGLRPLRAPGASEPSLFSRSAILRSKSRILACASCSERCASVVPAEISARIAAQSSLLSAPAAGAGRVGSCVRLVISCFCVSAAVTCASSTERWSRNCSISTSIWRCSVAARLRVRARHEHAARINGANFELARRVALDADRAFDGARGKILKQQSVLTLLELHLGNPHHLGAHRKHRDGIDARDRWNLGRCARHERPAREVEAPRQRPASR